jgi:hypothetical protein
MSTKSEYNKKYKLILREKVNVYMNEYQKQYYLNNPDYRTRQIQQKRSKYQFQKEAKRLMAMDLFEII